MFPTHGSFGVESIYDGVCAMWGEVDGATFEGGHDGAKFESVCDGVWAMWGECDQATFEGEHDGATFESVCNGVRFGIECDGATSGQLLEEHCLE